MRGLRLVLALLLVLTPVKALLSNSNLCEAQGYAWLPNSNYPGTYSFTDDALGALTGFTEDATYPVNGEMSVVQSFKDHNKVLKLRDDSGWGIIYKDIGGTRTNGTVEFWMTSNTTGAGSANHGLVQQGVAWVAGIMLSAGSILYTNSAGSWVNSGYNYSANEWYHVKIEWIKNSVANYYINGLLIASTVGANRDATKFEVGVNSVFSYVDAIGFSWDPNYRIGDNLVGGCCGDDVIDLRKGLVSEWHLDENTGTQAADNISSNQATLVNNPSFVSGKFGNSLSLTGTQYGNIAQSSSLDLSSSFSFSAWIKTTQSTEGSIFRHNTDGTNSDQVLLRMITGGYVQVGAKNSGSSWVFLISSNTVNDNNWHHIVGTMDGSVLKIYIDNIFRNVSASFTPNNYGSSSWIIGRYLGGSEYYNGLIDELRVYNRALSDREIAYLYEMSPYAYINYTDNFHNGTKNVDSGYCVAGDYYTDLDLTPRNYCNYLNYSYISKDWLNEGFKYRKNITISSSSALTDYQVSVNPNTYNTTGLVASYHFSEESSLIRDYSGINNYGGLYGSTVGLWHLDEGTGSSVYDSTINSGTGTITGATWTKGVYGSALSFSGTAQYVSIPHNAVYNIGTGDVSFSAWFKTSASGITQGFIGKANPAANYQGFSLFLSTNNKVAFYVTDCGTGACGWGTTRQPVYSLNTLNDGKWHHAVGVRTAGGQALYIDGVFNNYLNLSSGPFNPDNTNPLFIGSLDASNYLMNGQLDEVGMYKKALTADEVKALYYSQRAKFIEYTEGYESKGTGLQTDGVSNYVGFSSFLGLPTNQQPRTITAWIKPETATERGFIFSYGDGVSGQKWDLEINGWDVSHDGKLLLHGWNVAMATTETVIASNLNKWTHVAVTYNGGAFNTVTLYVNGVAKATSCAYEAGGVLCSSNPTTTATNPFIGKRHDNTGYFKGAIDEVQVYNRALSAQEISDLYNERKGRLDYADLRFYNASGSELSYYTEYDNLTWVKVPSIPSGNSNITMYYGNPGAVSKSNGENTFDFFDDFNDGNVNTGKWQDWDVTAVERGDGILYLTGNTNDIHFYTIKTFTYPYSIRMRLLRGNDAGIFFDAQSGSGPAGYLMALRDSTYGLNNYELYVTSGGAGSWSVVTYSDPATDALWHVYELKRNGASMNLSEDGVSKLNATISTYSNGRVGIRGQGTATTYTDWIYVRKYASTEPTITTQGEESIYGNNTGLVSYWSFDNDIDNKTIDSIGKNTGSLYGSTVGLWRFDDNYYSPIDSTSYNNKGALVGNTLALWHFDEGTGSTTKDETGYARTATLTGGIPTWSTQSVSGNSLYFDGSSDYLTSSLTSIAGGSFSISVWAKRQAIGRQDIILLHGPADYVANYNLHMGFRNTNVFTLDFYGGAGLDTPAYTDTDWHHWVGTYDTTSNARKIYRDGVLVAQDTAGTDFLGTGTFYIGWYFSTYFQGYLDEMSVYNKPLSASEVFDLYNSKKAKFVEYNNTAKSGTSLTFDGINDYFSLNSQIAYDDSHDFTISLWYKGTDTEQNSDIGKVLLGRDNNDIWANLVLRSGYVEYIHYDTSWQHNIKSSTLVADNNWHHILFVNYGGTKTGSLWIDGIMEASGSTLIGSETYIFRIDGFMRGYNGKYTSGTIDEVAVYNKSLSADEVKFLYNSTRAQFMEHVQGTTGKGMEFNGVSYIKVPDNDELDFKGNKFTISLWTKRSGDSPQTSETLIHKEDGSSDYGGYYLWIDRTTKYPGLRIRNDANGNDAITSTQAISNNKWYHLVGTYDGTNLAIYVNGVVTSKTSTIIVGSTTSLLGIAAPIVSPSYSFNGTVDDVRVYNRDLSATEVSELYSSTASNYGCCGDDYYYDTFYNGTIGSTNYFCSYGNYINQEIDANTTLCNYYSYTWINNSNYPGTYSFTNDTEGSVPAGWTDGSGSSCSARVSDIYAGRSKVLKLTDAGSGSGLYAYAYQDFSSKTEGSVEGWVYKDSGSSLCTFTLYDSSASKTLIHIMMDADNNGKFYYSVGGQSIEFAPGKYADNKWFHIKVDFNTVTQKVNIYLNRELVVYQGNFYESGVTSANQFYANTASTQTGVCYYDAIAYSWDTNYQMSNNQIPSCCGDDAISDTFYNGTINTTSYFCHEGIFTNQEIDANDTICNYYYDWINGLNKTGSYLGTYSFTYDEDNTIPSGWFNASSGTGNAYIINNFEGHNKVLKLDGGTSPDNYARINNTFSPQTTGFVEFWVRPTADAVIAGEDFIVLRSGTTTAVYIKLTHGNCGSYCNVFQPWNGPSTPSNVQALQSRWHHLNITFDTSTDRYYLYIDGVLKASNYAFHTAVSSIDNILLQSYVPSGTRPVYFDAIGYSWDTDYNLGDNLKEDYFSCCGDDGASDTFYNGTINTTTYFCQEGIFTNQEIDANDTVCDYYGYTYFTGTITGAEYPRCCGDDALLDNFYNSTLTCSAGELLTDLDLSEISCTTGGHTWFTGSVSGSNGPCCGDDGASDNFYNGTINNTQNVCAYGVYSNQSLDYNKTLCQAFGYDWINPSTGLIAHWNLDDDSNKTMDDSGINHGSLYGSTIGLWRFDEGTGSTVYDGTSYNNIGTINNALWTTSGKSSNALSFDGSGDYVSIPDSNSLDFTNKISISAWVYQNIANTNNGIVYKGSFSGSQGVYSLIFDTSPSKLRFRLNGQITEGSGQVTSVSSFSTGQWYHVVATYDGAYQRVYINGLLDNSASYSTLISVDSNPLYLGAYYSTTYALNGKLDEVTVYNKTLTQAEVTEIYNAGKAKFIEYVNAKHGTGIEFNGEGYYVNIPYSSSLNLGSAGTISLWANIKGKGSTDIDYLNTLLSNVNSVGTYGWTLDYRYTDNKIDFYIANNGVTGTELFSNNPINLNEWVHITATYDGTTKKIYLNGILDVSDPETVNGISSINWFIGTRPELFTRKINGTIDDVRVYNRALNADEVMTLYKSSSYSGCCGDDGASDTFYNGTINTTSYFCHEGVFTNQEIDVNDTVCDYYGYAYFTGTITGTEYPRCCGDDALLDNFYNTTNICSLGQAITDLDYSESACLSQGHKWLTGTISGNTTVQGCCGDDGVNDTFYNATLLCSMGGLLTEYDHNYVEDLLGDRINYTSASPVCTARGYTWFNYSQFNYELKEIGTASGIIADIDVGDLDSDADLDIITGDQGVVGFYNGHVWKWINDGKGTFTGTDLSTNTYVVYAVEIEDIDLDGDNDVITASYINITKWTNTGGGNLVSSQLDYISGSGNNIKDMAFLDLENDGDLDFIINLFGGTVDGLYKYNNTGGGTYEREWLVTDNSDGRTVDAADFDSNGYVDFISSRTLSKAYYLWSNNAGTLTRTLFGTMPDIIIYTVIGDIDNDYDIDVIALDNSGNVYKWVNNGLASFTGTSIDTGSTLARIALGDIDGDADPDLIISRNANITLLINDGTGSFTKNLVYIMPAEVHAINLADINGDGTPDIIMGCSDSKIYALLNKEIIGTKGLCCGDDGISDTFYRLSEGLSANQNFCHYGNYINQSLDYNKTLCEYYNYTFINTSTGLIAHYRLDQESKNVQDDTGKTKGTLYGSTIGLWNFNEIKANTAIDSTSYNNHGTITGATWTSNGKFGNALIFDGVNDFVNVSHSSSLNLNNSLTISMWVKPGSVQLSYTDILSKHSNGGYMIEQSGSTTNSYYFAWDPTGSGSWTGNSITTSLTPNVWQHFLIVKNGASITHYVNGVVSASGVGSSANINPNTLSLNLGLWSSSGTTRFWNGTMDEVAIYNKSLTQTEVTEIYNAGKAKFIEYVNAKHGTGVQFDGVNNYVQVPHNNNLDITENLTISVWYKVTGPGVSGGFQGIVAKDDQVWDDKANYVMLLTGGGTPGSTVSGALELRWETIEGYSVAFNTQGTAYNNYNQWYHAVFVKEKYGSSNYRTKLYVNGIQQTLYCYYYPGSWQSVDCNNFNLNTVTNTMPLKIGVYGLPNIFFFNGTIDDVRIYNNALSSDEVMALYRNSAYSSCCGDDAGLDNFYNSTLNTTTFFCRYGTFKNKELDTDKQLCLNYNNSAYFTLATMGTGSRCCGDDLNDLFYELPYNTTSNFCINRQFINEPLDLNKTLCEHFGHEWINTTQDLVIHYPFDTYATRTNNTANNLTKAWVNWSGLYGYTEYFTAPNGHTGVYVNITGSAGGGSNWYKARSDRLKVLNGTKYTMSAVINYTVTPSNALFYIYQFNSSGNILTEGGYYNSANQESLGDGWYYAYATFTTHTNTTEISFMGFDYNIKEIKIYDVQFENKSFTTPYQNASILRNDQVKDYSGNNRHASLNDKTPRWTNESKVGTGSYEFNGTNYITGTLPLSAINGNELTVSAWIKPYTVTGTQYIVIKNGPFLFGLNGNKLYAGIHNNSWDWIVGNQIINPNVWTLVTLVYDGSNIKLYVNGTFDKQTPKYGPMTGDGCLLIGRCSWGGCAEDGCASYFNGLIDDVRIYKRALSEKEISIMYDGMPYASCCGDDLLNDNFYNGSLQNANTFCNNGKIITQSLDNNDTLCTYYGYYWLNNSNGTNFNCCGDDGLSDNFYNGSISSTMNFCYNGNLITSEIDQHKELCAYYNYTWINTNEEILQNGTNFISNGMLNITVLPTSNGFSIYPFNGTAYSSLSLKGWDWGFDTGEFYDETNEEIITYKDNNMAYITWKLVDRHLACCGGGDNEWRTYKIIIYPGQSYADVFVTGSDVGLEATWYVPNTPLATYAFNSTSEIIYTTNPAAGCYYVNSRNNNYTGFYEPGSTTLNFIKWKIGGENVCAYHGESGKFSQFIKSASYYRIFSIINSSINSISNAREIADHNTNLYISCCGDDAILDTFYNGTISTTSNFCYQGNYTNQTIDEHSGICAYYNYDWLNNTYPATYSFDNDAIGSVPNGWSYGGNIQGNVSIIQGSEGHEKVIQLYRIAGSSQYYSTSPPSYAVSNGTIEWYARFISGTDNLVFYTTGKDNCTSPNTYPFIPVLYPTYVSWTNGSSWHSYSLNGLEWHKFKIVFDCMINKYDFYVDDVLIAKDNNYRPDNYCNNLTRLYFQLDGNAERTVLIDSLSYSWDTNPAKNYSKCCGDDVTDLRTGLLSEWHFNEITGNTTFDSIGNSIGIVNGATWTTGKYDNALSFDGINDNVSVSNAQLRFNHQNSFTLSAWIKPNDITSFQHILGTGYQDYRLSVYNNGLSFRLDSNNLVLEGGLLKQNDWNHVTALYDSINKKATIYIDGVKINEQTNPTLDWTSSLTFKIGVSDTYYFNGLIDEVRVYNRALKPDEVQALYTSSPYAYYSREDFANATLKCCCNSELINTGETCDTNEDLIIDSVCGNGHYCNSSTTPTITMSEKALNPASTLYINVTSSCQPNLIIIYPNLTEKELSTTSCGNNCYTSSITLNEIGYYHVQAFNGKYNYDLALVKNATLFWTNPWMDNQENQFSLKRDIKFNNSLTHPRINQLITMPVEFNITSVYCNDTNLDNDLNDVSDLTSLRLTHKTPEGYYEMPLSIENINCTNNNLTSATIKFNIQALPGTNEWNTYSLFYGPQNHTKPSYVNKISYYNEGAERHVNTTTLRMDYSTIRNITEGLYNNLGTKQNLKADGDVIISPVIIYYSGTSSSLYYDGEIPYIVKQDPASINYELVNAYFYGADGWHPVNFTQTYNPDSYYLIINTSFGSAGGITKEAMKYFDLNLNKSKFTTLAKPGITYNLSTQKEFDYYTKWITLFNNQTGDGIALIRINTNDPLINAPRLNYSTSLNNSIISLYPITEHIAPDPNSLYQSSYALMVYNHSKNWHTKINNVWEWLNTTLNYTLSEESVSFGILSYSFDEFVDKTDELISINATVYSNTQNITALHTDIYDETGNRTLSENYDCNLIANFMYECNFTISPEYYDCKQYNASIYAIGIDGITNTTSMNFTFNIDDIIGTYTIPQDTMITTSQELKIAYEYCSRTNISNANLRITRNNEELYNNKIPSTGEYTLTYTNPETPGNVIYTLNATDNNYRDYKEFNASTVKSIYELNINRKSYSQGVAGYRSNFITVTNPSSKSVTYTIDMIPTGIIARFSENNEKTIMFTLQPYTSKIALIDVFPVIIGNYQIKINAKGQVPLDAQSFNFDVIVQTTYSSGVFSYVLIPGIDTLAILTLLVIACIYLIKKA